jgi:hypothetical protein
MDKQFTRKEIKANIQRLRRSIISRKIKKSEIHYQVYDLQPIRTKTMAVNLLDASCLNW